MPRLLPWATGKLLGDHLVHRATIVLERLPLGRNRPVLAYACTLAICLAAFGIRLATVSVMPTGYPFVAFFPTVMLSTFLFGVRRGIFAAVICGLLAWFCFLPPFYSTKMTGSAGFAMGFYAAVAGVNILFIHALQRINERLGLERERNRQLAERGELLFRELQHRVSNNLQVVSGLLALQTREISDEKARFALDEASRRLGLIGRIHRQLYNPHGEQLHLSAFLEKLCADLVDSSGKPGVELRVEIDEDVDLPSDAAVPMALIISEAVTNAIEHGFAGRETGLILIRGDRVADGTLELKVIDDGGGLPAQFGETEFDSLGLKLCQMLARQLGGSFSLFAGDRTTALLRLP